MDTGRIWRASVMTAVVASASVYVPAAVAQSAPSNAELANLVKQQAAQIQRLNARIDQMEQQNGQSSRSAASAANAQPTRGNAPRQKQPSVPSGEASEKATYANNGGQGNQNLEQRVSKLEKDHVKVDWSDGAPEFSSADGDYTFGIGGRIQYDQSGTFGSRYDGENDRGGRNVAGSEFRRLRLDAHGQVSGWLLYKLELDFAGDSVGLRDAYLAAKKNFQLGKGVVYLGSKFSDRGLDARTSSKWTWFTERNTVANGIEPASGAYATGLTGEFYGDDNWHASLAVTKGSNTGDNDSSNNFTVLSRAHWDPIATDNYILHIGANGFYEDFENARTPDDFDKSVTIGGHFNNNLRIASDVINPSSSAAFGLELAGLAGPFAAGAEYGHRTLKGRGSASDLDYDAYSGQIGYALTGEQFGYSTKQGVWTRPEIAHPVTQGGIGDWELMARYEAIDFEDSAAYQGGTGHGTTVGLNWYLNKYTKMMLDYTRWRTNNRLGNFALPDDGNSINARAQIVF